MPNRTDGVYAMAPGRASSLAAGCPATRRPAARSPPIESLDDHDRAGYPASHERITALRHGHRIRPERLEEYRELHADSHPGVRDLLHAAHMRNFSIYLQRLPDGHHYLFGYYEYDGTDYAADMARLAAEPRNREWLARCGPMQIPLPGEPTWKQMERVYYNP